MRVSVGAALIALLAAFAGGAGAAEGPARDADDLRPAVPNGFELKASNGYTLSVYGFAAARGESSYREGDVYLLVERPGEVVAYVPDQRRVRRGRITATIDGIATIDVRYVRSTGVKRRKRFCEDRVVRYEAGHYEGTIEFHGEQGFADVSAREAPGTADLLAKAGCSDGYGEVRGKRAKGALLEVETNGDVEQEFDPDDPLPTVGPQVQLTVAENRGAARARVNAVLWEDQGPLFVAREVEKFLPASWFDAPRSLRTARFRPAAGPFAGAGRYDAGAPRARGWSGDLTVDLPGRSDVSLVGPGITAFLSHASYFKEKPYPYD